MNTQIALRMVAAGALSVMDASGAPSAAGTPGVVASAELETRAARIKATPEELKWQQIPWVLDLAEGQRLAKEEKRPLLLWATGDDPLERC
jgi:hypothetical protein